MSQWVSWVTERLTLQCTCLTQTGPKDSRQDKWDYGIWSWIFLQTINFTTAHFSLNMFLWPVFYPGWAPKNVSCGVAQFFLAPSSRISDVIFYTLIFTYNSKYIDVRHGLSLLRISGSRSGPQMIMSDFFIWVLCFPMWQTWPGVDHVFYVTKSWIHPKKNVRKGVFDLFGRPLCGPVCI